MIETLDVTDVLKTLVITEILRKVPVWAGLKDESLENLAAEFQVVNVAAGETVFHEGEPGTACTSSQTGRRVSISVIVTSRNWGLPRSSGRWRFSRSHQGPRR